MTFDPMSVEVTCVTLPKDHRVQVPWQYINVCGYSDQFCKIPHTYTYIHTAYYILRTEWVITESLTELSSGETKINTISLNAKRKTNVKSHNHLGENCECATGFPFKSVLESMTTYFWPRLFKLTLCNIFYVILGSHDGIDPHLIHFQSLLVLQTTQNPARHHHFWRFEVMGPVIWRQFFLNFISCYYYFFWLGCVEFYGCGYV